MGVQRGQRQARTAADDCPGLSSPGNPCVFWAKNERAIGDRVDARQELQRHFASLACLGPCLSLRLPQGCTGVDADGNRIPYHLGRSGCGSSGCLGGVEQQGHSSYDQQRWQTHHPLRHAAGSRPGVSAGAGSDLRTISLIYPLSEPTHCFSVFAGG